MFLNVWYIIFPQNNQNRTFRNKTDDIKEHRYYIGIFIPTENRCIEVKGEWFYKRDKNILKLKKQEAEKLGYKYDLWVYNKKKEKIICFE